MPSNITGVGFVATRIEGFLHPLLASAFSFSEEKTSQDAEGYPVNSIAPLQITDTVTTKSVYTVKLGVQSLDFMDMAHLIFDQQPYAGSNITIPVLTSGTIPAVSPYEITVTGLTSDQVVDVTYLDDSDPGKQSLTQIAASGTPGDGEYEVNANKLIFNAAQAGKNVVIYYQKVQTSLDIVGGTASANEYGNLEIFGKLKTTRTGTLNLWFPRCKVSTGSSLDVKADTFERDYKASVPTDLGFSLPYMFWQSP